MQVKEVYIFALLHILYAPLTSPLLSLLYPSPFITYPLLSHIPLRFQRQETITVKAKATSN